MENRFLDYIPRGLYTFHKAVVREARGTRVIDEQGRVLLDLTSGLGVLPLGHCDERILHAAVEQGRKFVHMSAHLMYHRPYMEIAERLDRLVPIQEVCKSFLCNSGAEAVENAVKIARNATGRRIVLAFQGGYHGRTLLGMTLTGKARPYRTGFGPLAPDVFHLPYAYCYRCPWGLRPLRCGLRCLDSAETFFSTHYPAEDVAAVIIEPIQGEGGVVVPPREFLERLTEICRSHGIVIIADEIQTGLARAGRMFASEHAGLEPDIVLTGKALGGGLPLAAVTGRARLMDAPHSSGLGSTFGGNAVACAAALKLLEILETEALGARALEIHERILKRALLWRADLPWIGEVRGQGAMIGIEIVKDRETREPAATETRRVVRESFERGAIVLSGGLYRNVIRLLPPLTIPWEELDAGLDRLEEALREL